jgi:hypothetical protein
MTGYQSKKAAAQDKLAQPAPELTMQEQLDKAEADRRKAYADLCEAYEEVKRIKHLMEINK